MTGIANNASDTFAVNSCGRDVAPGVGPQHTGHPDQCPRECQDGKLHGCRHHTEGGSGSLVVSHSDHQPSGRGAPQSQTSPYGQAQGHQGNEIKRELGARTAKSYCEPGWHNRQALRLASDKPRLLKQPVLADDRESQCRDHQGHAGNPQGRQTHDCHHSRAECGHEDEQGWDRPSIDSKSGG